MELFSKLKSFRSFNSGVYIESEEIKIFGKNSWMGVDDLTDKVRISNYNLVDVLWRKFSAFVKRPTLLFVDDIGFSVMDGSEKNRPKIPKCYFRPKLEMANG